MDSIKFHNIPSKVVPFPFKKENPFFFQSNLWHSHLWHYHPLIWISNYTFIFRLGHLPLCVTFFIHPSVRPCAPYLRNHSSWDHNFWSMCKMMISLGRFSIFSKFWFFGLFVGQKMTKWPKMKRFCLSHFILQEPYILWFSFMVGMCKMIISSGVFFIFLKFWFSGLLGGKRVKNCQKWQKILLLTLHVSGNIHHMIVICGTQV